MITLGIDLSSQPEKTVACALNWKRGQVVASEPMLRCNDERLAELIQEADIVGIDAPFGWPLDFVAAVTDWPHESWTKAHRDRLRFRETDRMIKQRFGIDPLSVSTDRIALPAMRAMSLLRRFGVTDRSGDGRFFEVYPAATLVSWSLSRLGYKDVEFVPARRRILRSIRRQLPWLVCSDAYQTSSDALDALLASLTARLCGEGRTTRPSRTQSARARKEGWIHVPEPDQWPDMTRRNRRI